MKRFIAIAVVAQIVILMFFLYLTGKVTKKKLSLVWNAIVASDTAEDAAPAKQTEESKKGTPAVKPQVVPNYDEILQLRAAKSQELERKERELRSLLELIAQKEAELDSKRQSLQKLREELQKDFKEKQDETVKAGMANLLALLEVEQPRLAMTFLLQAGEKDEPMVLGIIKDLDPVLAAKIFKEFQQPEDIRKLNDWLQKVGQGEPQRSELSTLKSQVPNVQN